MRVKTKMHLSVRGLVWATLIAAAQLVLAGCTVLSPESAEVTRQSESLARQQHQQATEVASSAKGRRVWFAGFAMNSTTHAFQGDLELTASRLSAIGGPVIRYEYSNDPQTRELQRPFANQKKLAETIRRISEQTRPEDVVVLLVATHGAKGLLSVNAGNKDYAPMTTAQLSAALAPLGDTPTVVLLSACHSGSFIPALQADTRIVLTAASADRSSYGCNFQNKTTFFIEELLDHHFDPSMSLAQLMSQAQAQIAKREATLKLTPSQPQAFVGEKVKWLAERPLKNWFEDQGAAAAMR